MQFKPSVHENIALAREALKIWEKIGMYLWYRGLSVSPIESIILGFNRLYGLAVKVYSTSIKFEPDGEAELWEHRYVMYDSENKCYQFHDELPIPYKEVDCTKLIKVINSLDDKELEEKKRKLEELINALRAIESALKLT